MSNTGTEPEPITLKSGRVISGQTFEFGPHHATLHDGRPGELFTDDELSELGPELITRWLAWRESREEFR